MGSVTPLDVLLQTLPAEILSEILRASIAVELISGPNSCCIHHNVRGPIKAARRRLDLCLVCKKWAHTVYSTPRAWTSLTIEFAAAPSLITLTTAIDNAKCAPMEITIDIRSGVSIVEGAIVTDMHDFVRSCFDLLAHRFKHVAVFKVICVDFAVSERVLGHLARMDCARVSKLYLDLRLTMDPNVANHRASFTSSFPSLVRLYNAKSLTPSVLRFTGATVTDLRLDSLVDDNMRWEHLHAALSGFPHLLRLDLGGVICSRFPSSPARLVFSMLTHLTFGYYVPSMAAVLSFISTPALHSLRLSIRDVRGVRWLFSACRAIMSSAVHVDLCISPNFCEELIQTIICSFSAVRSLDLTRSPRDVHYTTLLALCNSTTRLPNLARLHFGWHVYDHECGMLLAGHRFAKDCPTVLWTLLQKLPPELLSSVLLLATKPWAADAVEVAKTRGKLCLVCKSWATTLYRTPRAWARTTIVFEAFPPIETLITTLKNSKAVDKNIAIEIGTNLWAPTSPFEPGIIFKMTEFIHTCFTLLEPYLSTIASLGITCPEHTLSELVLAYFSRMDFGRVNRLSLTMKMSARAPIVDRRLAVSSGLPRLTHLYASKSLPPSVLHFTGATVTSLSLVKIISCDLHWSRLRFALRAFPVLRHLRMDSVLCVAFGPNPQRVSFKQLTHLSFYCFAPSMVRVLRYIDTPTLYHLRLGFRDERCVQELLIAFRPRMMTVKSVTLAIASSISEDLAVQLLCSFISISSLDVSGCAIDCRSTMVHALGEMILSLPHLARITFGWQIGDNEVDSILRGNSTMQKGYIEIMYSIMCWNASSRYSVMLAGNMCANLASVALQTLVASPAYASADCAGGLTKFVSGGTSTTKYLPSEAVKTKLAELSCY
ncbi:hypothetical protein C8R47DRAFT_1081977 [Mycena vitilis]|nr:hypothetical protein C8R47DRAFT_1081977 [Mycena vitilis]